MGNEKPVRLWVELTYDLAPSYLGVNGLLRSDMTEGAEVVILEDFDGKLVVGTRVETTFPTTAAKLAEERAREALAELVEGKVDPLKVVVHNVKGAVMYEAEVPEVEGS